MFIQHHQLQFIRSFILVRFLHIFKRQIDRSLQCEVLGRTGLVGSSHGSLAHIYKPRLRKPKPNHMSSTTGLSSSFIGGQATCHLIIGQGQADRSSSLYQDTFDTWLVSLSLSLKREREQFFYYFLSPCLIFKYFFYFFFLALVGMVIRHQLHQTKFDIFQRKSE